MQPVLSATSTALGAGDGGLRGGGGGGGGGAAARSRRSTAINYAEPPSGDEGLDAGAIDSDDSDFVASGGVRTSIRRAGRPPGGTPHGRGTPQPFSGELDQSYLGMIPPSRFITAKPILPTVHEYLYVPFSLTSPSPTHRVVFRDNVALTTNSKSKLPNLQA